MKLREMNSDDKMRVLLKVCKIPGTRNKLAELGRYPEMKPLIKTIYNPFMSFYISPQKVPGRGAQLFDEYTSKLLMKLHTRKLSGKEAVNVVRDYQKNLTPLSASLFDLILDKNARIGVAAKTINKLWPGLIPRHEIMLAHLYDEKRVTFPCFASPKYDGLRAIYRNGKFYSRKGHYLMSLDPIADRLKQHGITVVLDGEAVVPTMSFQEGTGRLRQKARCPLAEFHVFDIIDFKTPFYQRLEFLADLLSESIEGVKLVRHQAMRNADEINVFYQEARVAEFEGVVVKSFDHLYQDARSYDWMKIKPRKDREYTVLGVYEGEYRLTGMLGGIVVEHNGQVNYVGSGFTDKQRKEWWTDPSLIVNKVVTVEYMEETDNGNLRHSRFKGIRHD